MKSLHHTTEPQSTNPHDGQGTEREDLPCFSKTCEFWKHESSWWTNPHESSKHESSWWTRHRAGRPTVLFKNMWTLKFKATNTHKTDRNPPVTNHKPWPFEPLEVKFCFLKGPLESAQSSDFVWRRRKPQNPKTFLTWQVMCYPKQL